MREVTRVISKDDEPSALPYSPDSPSLARSTPPAHIPTTLARSTSPEYSSEH